MLVGLLLSLHGLNLYLQHLLVALLRLFLSVEKHLGDSQVQVTAQRHRSHVGYPFYCPVKSFIQYSIAVSLPQ